MPRPQKQNELRCNKQGEDLDMCQLFHSFMMVQGGPRTLTHAPGVPQRVAPNVGLHQLRLPAVPSQKCLLYQVVHPLAFAHAMIADSQYAIPSHQSQLRGRNSLGMQARSRGVEAFGLGIGS